MRAIAFFPDGRHIIGLQEQRQHRVEHRDTGRRRVAELATGWIYDERWPAHRTARGWSCCSSYHSWRSGTTPVRPDNELRRCRHLHPAFACELCLPLRMGYSLDGTYFGVMSLDLMLFEPNARPVPHDERLRQRDCDGRGIFSKTICAFKKKNARRLGTCRGPESR